jgi:putative cell wall-binding protein
MNVSTDTLRRPRRSVAAIAALAVLIGLGVSAPAAAASTSTPSPAPSPTAENPREAVQVDPTLDAARIPSGDGVEQVAVAANFNAGYLISDYAFFNRTAMSEAEIQAFLESKSGTCQNTLCLDILRQDSVDWAATPRCDAYTGGTQELISRIIYKVQIACGVSAKVLLVTLQKEQGLITSTNPTTRAVNYALGYGCPDTAPCDPAVAGISQQLYRAAAQFQRYRLSPSTYNFQVGTENIQYHPNTACGTKRVTILNQATAGLYNYTPYTPNAAALNNLYGLGDSCSSYGNRNFWRLYTDWFGSPTTLVPSGVETERLAGSDRWATAARISSETYPSGASTVYIAVGTNFADGLAAGPAAALAGAPLLLVGTTVVPAATATELQRLNPTAIRIVGGTGVVSTRVQTALQQLVPGATITRYAGASRYATAEDIARQAFPQGTTTTVFLATGGGFADALAASAAAGSLGAPVLLVPPAATAVPASTIERIVALGATRIVIAGGTGVVSAGVATSAASIPGVTEVVRLGGADRYATAAAINDFAFPAATTGFIASGRNFPDALAAAAAAGALDAPLHLSNGVCTYTPSLQHLVDTGVSRVAFAGGTGVLRSTVTEFLTCG